MREFAKRRNGTLRKGLMFNFPAGSGCNKLWEITSLGQAPQDPTIMLQAQFERELHLWQTRHEFAEKSSKIVPLGAPFPFFLYTQQLTKNSSGSLEPR